MAFMRYQLKNHWVPELLRQAACYTKPPSPDYKFISTPYDAYEDYDLEGKKNHI